MASIDDRRQASWRMQGFAGSWKLQWLRQLFCGDHLSDSRAQPLGLTEGKVEAGACSKGAWRLKEIGAQTRTLHALRWLLALPLHMEQMAYGLNGHLQLPATGLKTSAPACCTAGQIQGDPINKKAPK